eukprot:269546-Chlamydomonas_euryale.AAC.1
MLHQHGQRRDVARRRVQRRGRGELCLAELDIRVSVVAPLGERQKCGQAVEVAEDEQAHAPPPTHVRRQRRPGQRRPVATQALQRRLAQTVLEQRSLRIGASRRAHRALLRHPVPVRHRRQVGLDRARAHVTRRPPRTVHRIRIQPVRHRDAQRSVPLARGNVRQRQILRRALHQQRQPPAARGG